MASTPARESGRLEDMAVSGTTIPEDSAKPRVIRSVPGPEDTQVQGQEGATNARDLPSSEEDGGATGEVVTGTGNSLPGNVENKRLESESATPAAKGHQRDAKHSTAHTDSARLD